MKGRLFRKVDPRVLRLPSNRAGGADPAKLQTQIARFGRSFEGMPPIEVCEGADGELLVIDGVTRATRSALLAPGQLATVEVNSKLRKPVGQFPKVGDRLP